MRDGRWEGFEVRGKKSGGQEERRRDVLMFCLSLSFSLSSSSRVRSLIVDKVSGVQPPLLLPHENALRG